MQLRRAVTVASVVVAVSFIGWVALRALGGDRPASVPSPAVSLERAGHDIIVTRYLAPDCERFDRVDVDVEGDTATVTVLFAPTGGGPDRGCLAYCPTGTQQEVVDLRRFTRHPERVTELVDGGAGAGHCAAP